MRRPTLTELILRVRHERFLHGLRRLNFVLLLRRLDRRLNKRRLRDQLELLDHGYVAESLGDRQSCLTVL